jgi:ankyrin repeat protein
MNGWMPLMSASAMGHTEVVRLLLAAGAHPWAKDKDGDTALKFAEESGHSEVVQVLRRVSV